MSDQPGPELKTAVYARFGNRALLELVRANVPPGGSVLDVGCASGGLLAELRDLAGRREGVEPDPVAARAACAHADRVHIGGIHEEVEVIPRSFDVVVLGDVLEHISDAAAGLRVAARWARPGGALVVSLPNVAHWSVRARLLVGRWDYQASGILDSTHLRFFTWRTAEELVREVDLHLADHRAVATRLSSHLPVRVPEPVERAWARLAARRPGLFAFQQLLVVRVP